jgi:hypothetical protein
MNLICSVDECDALLCDDLLLCYEFLLCGECCSIECCLLLHGEHFILFVEEFILDDVLAGLGELEFP